MQIVSLSTKQIYDIDIRKYGENAMPCPECSKDRNKKKAKSFSFNATKKFGFCHHCQTKFVEYTTEVIKKDFIKPIWKNKTDLTDGAVQWFEKRGITQDTLVKMKVYSDVEYMPQIQKETGVICFPYFMDGELINIKFRDRDKNFKLVKDAELIFYNIDCVKNNNEIIIVEGEMDCLSYIQAGFDNCISVPNGASATNLEYLNNYIELFDEKTIYISTDADIKGYELRAELIRRFGQERCKIINLEDKKDANEYIQQYGINELRERVELASYLPVDGIIDIESNYDELFELYLNGMQRGMTIGIDEFDKLVSWELGRLATVTGIPGHGKSELVDYLVVKLCKLYGWKVGFFSPENYPIKNHFSKLSSKIIGKSFDAKFMSKEEFEKSIEYIKDNMFFVYPEDDMTFDNIMQKAKFLVKKYGIKQFVIDPYNKIEHSRDRGESETDYISRILDKMLIFAKKYQVLFWLVAHPRKMNKTNNTYDVPTMYDINGSANFYNKTDYGMTVYRDYVNNVTQVHVQKVKFKHLGEGGMTELKYNWKNGRYESTLINEINFDNKSYLEEKVEQIEVDFVEPTILPDYPKGEDEPF